MCSWSVACMDRIWALVWVPFPSLRRSRRFLLPSYPHPHAHIGGRGERGGGEVASPNDRFFLQWAGRRRRRRRLDERCTDPNHLRRAPPFSFLIMLLRPSFCSLVEDVNERKKICLGKYERKKAKTLPYILLLLPCRDRAVTAAAEKMRGK